MYSESKIYKEVKHHYLKFLKSQEVLSEPFRDKIGQLNNFYIPLSKKILKLIKKIIKQKLLVLQAVKARKVYHFKYFKNNIEIWI